MRTYPIPKGAQSGPLRAFEIDNAFITLSALMRALARVPGVTDVRRGGSFFSGDDVRIRFSYRGSACVVWEPWGDSSRYWIGPDDSQDNAADMATVRDAFDRYRPALLMNLLGISAKCASLLLMALVWVPAVLLRLLVARRPGKPGKIRGS